MSGVGLTGAPVPLNGGNFTVSLGNNVPDLATLASFAGCVTGTTAFVLDQNEFYQYDSTNTFTTHPTLIIAGSSGGRWFRRNKAYVVGNFTLWAQSYAFGLVGFTAGQQLVTSSAAPDIVLNMTASIPGSSNQQGITVDSFGNPWMNFNTFNTGFKIQKYSLKDCLASGSPTASITLSPQAVIDTEAGYTLFDKSNNLWIPNGTHGTFGITAYARLGARQYGLTGSPNYSSTTVAAASPPTSNQTGGAFDAAGNLWSSFGFTTSSNGGILMFTAAQLALSGAAVAPTVLWAGSNFTASSLGGTNNLAFSPKGLLWSCQYGNGAGTVVRAWDPTQGSGNPAPAVSLTCASFSGPYALAFDSSGNLWVSNGNDNKLMRIPAAQLVVSGAVTPDVILTPAGTTLTSNIAFPNDPDRSGILLAA